MSTVTLSTLRKWSFVNLIGYDVEEIGDKRVVTKAWCKICAKHAVKVRKSLRGRALKEFDSYVSGTSYVSKYTLERHLLSKCHAAALTFENDGLASTTDTTNDADGEPVPSSSSVSTPGPKPKQMKIDSMIRKSARSAYQKLFVTAYLLAISGQPLTTFQTLVLVQKANGVSLVTGHDNSDTASHLIDILASAVRHKLCQMITASNFFAVLSDGSQPRKTLTGCEKELIYIRTVKNGSAVYYCAALQDMDTYGDGTAENLKKCLDDALMKSVGIPERKHTMALVAATADGAAVNTGQYSGLLTRLSNDREWLIKVHCVMHRIELAIKDSLLKDPSYSSIRDLLIVLHYLLKQSGKVKRNIKDHATQVLGVRVLNTPKVHGTRFISHQNRGLDHLLNNWVVLCQVIENMIASGSARNVEGKLRGILKKLKDSKFLCLCVLYKQIIQEITYISLKFQNEELMVFEVKPLIDSLIVKLREMEGDDETSPPSEFALMSICGMTLDANVLTSKNLKTGHKKKKKVNQEYLEIKYEGMISRHDLDHAIKSVKHKIVPILVNCIETRFQSFSDDIFQSMTWVDPANWIDSKLEIAAIKKLAYHFSVPLELNGFDLTKVKQEWKDFKHLVRSFYPGVKAKRLWKNVLTYRRDQFPNICLLAELILTLSPSNSIVESGFSHLTCMLTDRRLSLSHSTMENLLLLKVNHHVWSETERDEIIEYSLNKYMEKRRTLKLDNTPFNLLGTKKVTVVSSETSSDDSDSDGSNAEAELSDDEPVLSQMEPADESDVEFSGFSDSEIEAAERNLLLYTEDPDADFSLDNL